MAMHYRFGSKKRDELWSREAVHAHKMERGPFPICNLCDEPVTPGQAWHESHCPSRPKAFGGKSVGIGHKKCNLDHGAQVVTPMVAKAERVRKNHLGIRGPGLGNSPMRGSRHSDETITMRHGVQRRHTLAQKHQQLMTKRYGFLTEPEAQS